VGGPARYYVRAEDSAAVAAAVAWASDHELPLLVLGGGSNVVVSDDGWPGLVLHVDLRGAEWNEDGGELRAAAGEDWDGLVEQCVHRGWAGFECLSGIPGRAGATPIQNVGAYGQEVGETLVSVEALDRTSGETVVLANAECELGYRDSRFKRADRDRFVVLAVRYALQPGGAPAVRYPDLERELHGRGIPSPTLADVREAVLAVRRRKSMVLDAADPNSRSVGSFFMNPVLEEAAFEDLRERLEARGVDRPPSFPAAAGRVKVPAAWLIERAGIGRGHRLGRAVVSANHTLAIVNGGGATAREVVALAREVHDRVRDAFGISLQPEPVLVNLTWDVHAPPPPGERANAVPSAPSAEDNNAVPSPPPAEDSTKAAPAPSPLRGEGQG
jgi:UDP-N-acetylmuramate dehydrogenase